MNALLAHDVTLEAVLAMSVSFVLVFAQILTLIADIVEAVTRAAQRGRSVRVDDVLSPVLKAKLIVITGVVIQ